MYLKPFLQSFVILFCLCSILACDDKEDTEAKVSTSVLEDTVMTGQNIDTMEVEVTINKVRPCRFLALGDSYTIGESVSPDMNWPRQLTDTLNANENSFAAPQIIAKTGWTTTDLLAAISETISADSTYDLVSLLIGVNNQYRSYYRNVENFTTAYYEDQFTLLLKSSIALANNDTTKVIVLSIPDYSVTPFVSNRDKQQVSLEIDEYNEIAEKVCKSFQVAFIDINPISKKAASETALIAGDGLHPSAAMYTLWTQEVLKRYDINNQLCDQ